MNEGEVSEPHEAALVRVVSQALYEKGIAWIAYQRWTRLWPPPRVDQCATWMAVRMLADIHDMDARKVAVDLVDYVKRSEKGERQP